MKRILIAATAAAAMAVPAFAQSAGGVILTTVTDVMGFLSFLGLATIILLH